MLHLKNANLFVKAGILRLDKQNLVDTIIRILSCILKIKTLGGTFLKNSMCIHVLHF